MRKKTIEKAVKTINRSISYYQRQLTFELELRAEKELLNGNLCNCAKSLDDNEKSSKSNIEKYEIALADLATVKRALKANQDSVRILSANDERGFVYFEVLEVLRKAGLYVEENDRGMLWLSDIKGLPNVM